MAHQEDNAKCGQIQAYQIGGNGRYEANDRAAIFERHCVDGLDHS